MISHDSKWCGSNHTSVAQLNAFSETLDSNRLESMKNFPKSLKIFRDFFEKEGVFAVVHVSSQSTCTPMDDMEGPYCGEQTFKWTWTNMDLFRKRKVGFIIYNESHVTYFRLPQCQDTVIIHTTEHHATSSPMRQFLSASNVFGGLTVEFGDYDNGVWGETWGSKKPDHDASNVKNVQAECMLRISSIQHRLTREHLVDMFANILLRNLCNDTSGDLGNIEDRAYSELIKKLDECDKTYHNNRVGGDDTVSEMHHILDEMYGGEQDNLHVREYDIEHGDNDMRVQDYRMSQYDMTVYDHAERIEGMLYKSQHRKRQNSRCPCN